MARRNRLMMLIIAIVIVVVVYLAIVPPQQRFILDVSDAHALLAQGDGFPSTGSFHQPFMEYVVPNLVVYDNGLVLFACWGSAWPQICYRQVSLEQVDQITGDLDRVGFFDNQLKIDGETVGPHGIETIVAHTSAGYGEIHLEGRPLQLEPVRTAHSIVNALLKEDQVDKHLYQPDYVGLWVNMWSSATINQDKPKWPNRLCNDNTIPAWPFEFSPNYEAYLAYNCGNLSGYAPGVLELPQPIETVSAALGDLSSNYYYYRYRDLILSVEIRPYLPGENRQVKCANERWAGGFPLYNTLPFSSSHTTR